MQVPAARRGAVSRRFGDRRGQVHVGILYTVTPVNNQVRYRVMTRVLRLGGASAASVGMLAHRVVTRWADNQAVLETGMKTDTSKGTIVIADDEPHLRLVLERLLREEGYTVHSATDGVEALSLARSVRPDLLVLDIMMPNLDGSGVAAALRDDPATAHLPIVFLTAVLTHEDQFRLNQRRTDQVYLAKPYDVDELLATVRRMLGSAAVSTGAQEDTL